MKDTTRAELIQAKQALANISTASLTAEARTKVNELNEHLNALERSFEAPATAGTAAPAPGARSHSARGPKPDDWSSHVVAIDAILTELIGSPGAEPQLESTRPANLDAATVAQLQQVRTHLTAFAAAASGAGSMPAPSGPTGAPSSASATQTAGAPPASTGAQLTPSAEAARQHLSEARRILSEVTMMPAAAQLTGEARTQVSALIENFNALITAKTDWQPKYQALEKTLTVLLGPPASPSTSTPEAVGTSGVQPSIALDPTIKAKLEEFRNHLTAAAQTSAPDPPDWSDGRSQRPRR